MKNKTKQHTIFKYFFFKLAINLFYLFFFFQPGEAVEPNGATVKIEKEVDLGNSTNKNAFRSGETSSSSAVNVQRRQSLESTSNALPIISSVGTCNLFQKSIEELFGMHIANMLAYFPDDLSRRKLQIDIQEAILKAEKHAITSASFSTMNVVTSVQTNQFQKTADEQFGEYVAQRLAILPEDSGRFRLKMYIEEAIVKAGKEALK